MCPFENHLYLYKDILRIEEEHHRSLNKVNTQVKQKVGYEVDESDDDNIPQTKCMCKLSLEDAIETR